MMEMFIAAAVIATVIIGIGLIVGTDRTSGKELVRWIMMLILFIGGAITAGWMGMLTVLVAYMMVLVIGLSLVALEV